MSRTEHASTEKASFRLGMVSKYSSEHHTSLKHRPCCKHLNPTSFHDIRHATHVATEGIGWVQDGGYSTLNTLLPKGLRFGFAVSQSHVVYGERCCYLSLHSIAFPNMKLLQENCHVQFVQSVRKRESAVLFHGNI